MNNLSIYRSSPVKYSAIDTVLISKTIDAVTFDNNIHPNVISNILVPHKIKLRAVLYCIAGREGYNLTRVSFPVCHPKITINPRMIEDTHANVVNNPA